MAAIPPATASLTDRSPCGVPSGTGNRARPPLTRPRNASTLPTTGDGADDAVLGQLLARATEGVSRQQLPRDRGVQAGVGEGGDQVGVADGGRGARPGDDLSQESRAGYEVGEAGAGHGGRGHGRLL